MNPKKLILLLMALLALFGLAACNFTTSTGEEIDLDALATQVVLTVESEIRATLQAEAAAQEAAQAAEAEQQAQAPEAPAAEATVTPSPTTPPQPTATFTLAVPQVSVSTDTNCRTGPGKSYDWVGSLVVGQTANVIAVPIDQRDYVVIQNPNGGRCWLWLEYANISGDISGLPKWEIPPTPTPIPGSISGFVWDDKCRTGADPDDTPDGCVKPETYGDPYPSNGTYDSGEKGLAGVEVWMGEGTCPIGTHPRTTLTDSSGVFKFTKVIAGTYCIWIDTNSGPNPAILIPGVWRVPAGGNSYTVTLGSGEEKSGVDFGWDYSSD